MIVAMFEDFKFEKLLMISNLIFQLQKFITSIYSSKIYIPIDYGHVFYILILLLPRNSYNN